MTRIAFLIGVVIFGMTANFVALAQGDSARLVGLWRQHVGNENVVKFGADRTVSVYLRKGEIADLHTLDGKWTLDASGAVEMTFSVRGRSFTQKGQLSFVGDEMILTDEKGEQTRHVRHTGPLPDWTRW